METRRLSEDPDERAPDGSEVRFLARTDRASMAEFCLRSGATSRPIAHRTVDELWFTVSGSGEIWRSSGGEERVDGLSPGISVSIECGTAFQFRSTGHNPLRIVGVTTPPWPGDDEAIPTTGPWG